jgi:bacteriocin-like protein
VSVARRADQAAHPGLVADAGASTAPPPPDDHELSDEELEHVVGGLTRHLVEPALTYGVLPSPPVP